MVNFAVIQKILEKSGEDEKVIEVMIRNISLVAEELFYKKFVEYVLKKNNDEDALEEFIDMIDKIEEDGGQLYEKYQKWLEVNPSIDVTEFFEKYEEEMHQMQLEIIDGIKDSLDDASKREILDFIEKQKEEINLANREYLGAIDKIYKEIDARAEEDLQNVS